MNGPHRWDEEGNAKCGTKHYRPYETELGKPINGKAEPIKQLYLSLLLFMNKNNGLPWYDEGITDDRRIELKRILFDNHEGHLNVS